MPAKVEPMADPQRDAIPREADFLFHLYRGSELLHDNRLIEAQSELEYALSLETNDARTQGLLAVVYFRSGFYARAITTYRALLRDRPDDATLRLNVALCYLKTGQSQAARVELEALVMEDVTDQRAWGYLAVALDRLGYIDQAREGFERAGQPDLAQRMIDRGASLPRTTRSILPRSVDSQERHVSPRSSTFEDLDSGELSLDLVRAERGHDDPREERRSFAAPPAPPPPPVPRHDTLGWGTTALAADTPPARAWIEAPPLSNFIENARIERLGDAHGVTVLGTRLARIELDQTLSPMGFAFRLEALRSYSGNLDPEILPRQTRAEIANPHETPGETFGGVGTPFASMKGPGQLILGPRTSQRIQAFALHDEVVFFREENLLGFDLSLRYENGRLGRGSSGGDPAPLVQLHGSGTLLLELVTDLLALDVKTGGLTVRKEIVVGWVGRLLPRPLSVGEAPCGQRGLLGFSGDGTVLVSAK
jgi:Tetratricopeptide repeat